MERTNTRAITRDGGRAAGRSGTLTLARKDSAGFGFLASRELRRDRRVVNSFIRRG